MVKAKVIEAYNDTSLRKSFKVGDIVDLHPRRFKELKREGKVTDDVGFDEGEYIKQIEKMKTHISALEATNAELNATLAEMRTDDGGEPIEVAKKGRPPKQ